MVYAINNRFIFRGFHPCVDGKRTITKPDGRAVKGRWLSGGLTTVPMPTPPGATPQMPVLCISRAEQKLDSISNSTVCACTVSLFSGTWSDQDWDNLTKPTKQQWLKAGRSSADWKGIPVFEGDIFYHKAGKCYYVATYDPLHGFRLENAITGEYDMTWYFGLMSQRGCLWNPPKGFPMERLSHFHKARSMEVREEEIVF